MHGVIFRATVRTLDAEYARVAARRRELAVAEFGCPGFHAVTEGGQEVAVSYWPDPDAIRVWKADPEHLLARQAGCGRGYASYAVEVAELTRAYRFPA